MTFVPAYGEGTADAGSWAVTAAFVSPAWQRDQDPGADYAVLTVARRTVDGRVVQLADTAGTETLGAMPTPGTVVTVVGYNRGKDDAPVVCHATVYLHRGFPTFDCHGFASGSSGSPWLTVNATNGQTIVRGVIGGLHQGGCHEYTSHTSKFDEDVELLLTRAEDDAEPDSVATAADSGC